jgi:hypothetical protein
MKTNLGCIVAILLISGAGVAAQQARHLSQETNEIAPVPNGNKAAAREIEHYWGQAYLKDQMDLLDQLFSPGWRDLGKDASSSNSSSPAHNFKSGNELLTDCQQPQVSSAGVCAGYILGVLDTVSESLGQRNTNAGVCIPAGLDEWQAANAVKKYLAQHREVGTKPAAYVVTEAARVAWACGAKSN